MGDVVVVADPVHELAAAVVEAPAPVPVQAVLVVGEQAARAAPHVVVEVVGDRLGDLAFLVGALAGRQADLDVLDLADQAVEDDLGGDPEAGVRALLGAGLEDRLAFRDLR